MREQGVGGGEGGGQKRGGMLKGQGQGAEGGSMWKVLRSSPWRHLQQRAWMDCYLDCCLVPCISLPP